MSESGVRLYDRTTADALAVRAGRANRVRGVDRHARRGVQGSSRLLRQEKREVAIVSGAEIFLSVHLRVLLQSLRRARRGVDDRVSPARAGLARRGAWLVHAGLDRQRLHELV